MNQPLRSFQPGIRHNLTQFSLLVLINAFVGGMVGIERSILPLIAEQDFGISSRSAILSFLIGFGVVKGLTNLFAGRYADRVGRKKLLVAGWLIGLPVPFILIWAQTWSWIVAANLLLGVNQGLCWSMTVNMKIDLAGEQRRGLAVGLNEFAGYLAVAVAAFWSASLAHDFGLRPIPFYIGIGCSILGALISLMFVKDTHRFVSPTLPNSPPNSRQHTFKQIFSLVSYRNRSLFSASQAGLVNNLNDGMAWGLFPIFFSSLGYSLDRIGLLAALYPATWGGAQFFTGALSDRYGRKWMIVAGMWMQAISLWMMIAMQSMLFEIIAVVSLGIGTAMVYPTLLAAVGDHSEPEWRASAIGVYRLWRDLGYAVGALVSGICADLLGISSTIIIIGVVTFSSGIIVAKEFNEKKSRL